MYNPKSTYRIQFHKDFTLTDLERILPYLQELGVRTIYASPVFEAVPGSTHGYDSINSLRINPEIGSEEQLRDITKRLQTEGIGWLQDIVPNHAAFEVRNPWIFDVLEKGPQSRYASYFDIDWNNALHDGKLMVPFLGASVEEVIQKGDLKIAIQDSCLVLRYFETAYPVHPRSYATLLADSEGKKPAAVQTFLQDLKKLGESTDKEAYASNWDDLLALWNAAVQNKTAKKFIDQAIDKANGNAQTISKLAAEQTYRLCHWQETDYKINFRRFFTVNGLICLNIQTPEVLRAHHQLIKQLIKDGVFQGLRIDHIDGLYDPTAYLEQLRELAGDDTYIVVEKILEPGEPLPQQWPIAGSSGYDYLAQVNGLLTNKEAEKEFTRFYQELTHDHRGVQEHIYEKKKNILYGHMAGELENLYQLFLSSAFVEKRALASIHREDLKEAIAEFLIQCPVYRYYAAELPFSDAEAAQLQGVFNRIRKANTAKPAAITLLENVLLHWPHQRDEAYQQKARHFYQRCMQFTGPLMAKGVEDTVMYTYNRFIGHNEVGDAPEAFGVSVAEFHKMMQERQAKWPLAVNGTSTHDTKRGEDVRARLNVLTDLPDEWFEKVAEWQALNKPLKQDGAPDANDEYFIYQTIAGAYPMPGANDEAFRERITEYLRKALREAKVHSTWTTPDEAYEDATIAFAQSLLNTDSLFWKSFEPFHRKIADAGITNSLVQVLLKCTCPGVPDIYQGCEGWDFSLVDPDNRRPVDYETRMQALQSFEGKEAETLLPQLWEHRADARIKLWLTKELLHLRRQQEKLFTEGEYLPLNVEGKYKNNVIAFARKHRQQILIVAVPLHVAALCRAQEKDVLELDWADTRISLPDGVTGEWETWYSATKLSGEQSLPVKDLFTLLPFAIAKGHLADNERGAGLLLHISSLPSPFGIGDMGPEARRFADFLYSTYQKYWQLLPLNPTEAGQGHSPYSSISSRAGNTLFISPERLVEDGWLTEDEVAAARLPVAQQTDYEIAADTKAELFDKAFERFTAAASEADKAAFEKFCADEKAWLQEFALFSVLKAEHGGAAWAQWPEALRDRDADSLQRVAENSETAIVKTAWLQYQFAKQWKELRHYCNAQGIRLIGDLPIYVSYDSVDVWANRELFAIDAEGKMTGVAGTPPDAFSDDGQLWGMPVFKWDVLKEQGYEWWIDRLRRNTELFDLVRLDHFRAFADYWEVPAAAETAKGGSWKPGPGAEFFQAIQQALGGLPFVAEDLGEINKAVTDLRDQFHLPGMKILLFAFGDDMPKSDYIPHNYTQNFLVYTGTHDNNTVQGWYRTEASDAMRLRLEAYAGRPLSAAEVHLVLAQMAYSSVAKTAILPLQDLLGLDESSRMNMPGSGSNNWGWRLMPGQLNDAAGGLLRRWTGVYNRQ